MGNQPYTVTYRGLDEALRRLTEVNRTFKAMYGFAQPNRDARALAWQVATGMEPVVRQAIAGAPAPQADKVSATVRAKRDRVPIVRIGATIPKLSGMRKRGQDRRRHKGSIAWGVEYGPLGGHRSGPGQGRNFYKVNRSGRGYAIGRQSARLTMKARAEYEAGLVDILRRYGVI